jgi:hypothetical protein hcinC1_10606
MQEEKLSFKCEMFFGKNWKYIFWGIVVILLLFLWEINQISNRMQDLEKVVYENNGKVVFATADGRAIRVTKEPLKAENLKQYATSVFVNNFIASRVMLTKDFSKTNIATYKDILENTKPLGDIYLYFLDKENKEAVGQFVGYLQWLINGIAQDKIPEYINILGYTLNSFEYKDNRYSIDISIKVATNSYILALGKYRDEIGQIHIKAKGNFDLQRSSDANPYGMNIDEFSIAAVTKPNIK